MSGYVNPRGADLLRALDHSLCVDDTRRSAGFALLPDTKAERRSGLPPQVRAQLTGLQGAVDMLGDQIDIVLRDGLVAIGPVHDLLQQISVQARELFDQVRTSSSSWTAGVNGAVISAEPAHDHERRARAPGGRDARGPDEHEARS